MNILFIGNGFDLEHGINEINYKNFINSNIFRKEMKNYLSLFDEDKYKNSFPNSKLWSEFENFCFYISNISKIKRGLFYKKISISFSKWIESLNINSKLSKEIKSKKIEKILKSKKINTIISYNFTATPKLYSFKRKIFKYESKMIEWLDFKNWNKKYLHIHFFPSKKTIGNKCVIGHDMEKRFNKNWQIQNWNKKNEFNHKEKVIETLLEMDKNNYIESIFYFGFSFGNSDKCSISLIEKLNCKIEVYYKYSIPENIKNINKINFIKT